MVRKSARVAKPQEAHVRAWHLSLLRNPDAFPAMREKWRPLLRKKRRGHPRTRPQGQALAQLFLHFPAGGQRGVDVALRGEQRLQPRQIVLEGRVWPSYAFVLGSLQQAFRPMRAS